nr:MAG TPA: hypothetical protein [Caudoviricetes sp.]
MLKSLRWKQQNKIKAFAFIFCFCIFLRCLVIW